MMDKILSQLGKAMTGESANDVNPIMELKRLNDHLDNLTPEIKKIAVLIEHADIRNLTATMQQFYMKIWGSWQ